MRAAAEAVAARGLEGARVDQIARRAGANKAMISYHFGGKEALCRAALAEVLADLNDHLSARLAPPNRRGPDLIHDFLEAFGQAAARHPALPALFLRELLSAGRPGVPLAPEVLGVFSAAREVLARGVEDGGLRRADPWLGALTLIGAVTFLFAAGPLWSGLAARAGSALAAPGEGGLRDLQHLLVTALARSEGKE